MEAVGYARISIEDQSRNSIPGQCERITEYCNKNSLSLHKIYIENGQSAFNFDRKEWKELETFIKKTKSVKFLVIDTIDRFSRANLADALTKMDEIQRRAGVKIITVTDPINIDLDDFGTDLRRIMELMFSNYELKRIRKRTSDGMYTSMRNGRWASRAPFGYVMVRDPEGKPLLQIDEDKAFIVRMIFRQFLSGSQLEDIRKVAAANGMKLKSGSAVRRILDNPLYAALITLPVHGSYPISTVKAIHPPIISESDYWLAQGKLIDKTRTTQSNEKVFLKNVLYCHCGQRMTSDKARSHTGKHYEYYLCKIHRKRFSATKTHKKMEEILRFISLPLSSAASIGEKLKAVIAARTTDRTSDLMRVKLNLRKVQDRISSTQEKYLTQLDISEKVYNKVIGELKSDEHRLQNQVADLSTTSKDYYAAMEQVIPKLGNLFELYTNMTIVKKLGLLKLLFGTLGFENSEIIRTQFLHPFFSHNLSDAQLKKLLITEQLFPSTLISSPYGSEFEPLLELLTFLAA